MNVSTADTSLKEMHQTSLPRVVDAATTLANTSSVRHMAQVWRQHGMWVLLCHDISWRGCLRQTTRIGNKSVTHWFLYLYFVVNRRQPRPIFRSAFGWNDHCTGAMCYLASKSITGNISLWPTINGCFVKKLINNFTFVWLELFHDFFELYQVMLQV